MPWFFLSFWRFSEDLSLSILFFQHLKTVESLLFGLLGCWWEDHCHSNCFFFIGKVTFQSHCFQWVFVFVVVVFVFPFSLALRNLTIMFLVWVCLGLILSGITRLFEYVHLCLLTNLESFLPFYLEDYFCCFLFLLFWESNDINVRSFVIVSQLSEALFNFFSQSASLLYRLGHFCYSVFKFTGS